MLTPHTYELEAQYDSRQSFYRKAFVIESGPGVKYLRSYDTIVAKVGYDNAVELYEAWDSSGTTLRHVKEFLKQHGHKAETKAQIVKDYPEVHDTPGIIEH